MAYIIMTESTCDLSWETIHAHQELVVIPLVYYAEGKEYLDNGKGLSNEALYAILKKGGTVVTSQVGIHAFCEAARPWLSRGYDILYIGLSSGISGSFQSGALAMEELRLEFPARKMIALDSKAASLGLGLLVYLCLAEKEKGKGLEEVEAVTRMNIERLCEWFTVNDLFFLKRGGRISASTALVGSALGIKPILHVNREGRMVAIGKARGREQSIRALADKVTDLTGETVFAISYADCLEDAQKLERLIREKHQFQGTVLLEPLGPVVAAHGGSGSLALFFRGENR